jgi:hypothetical protein
MMNLYIDGYRSNDDSLVVPLTEASWYYGLKLLGGRMARHIILDMNLTNKLKEKTGAYGFTMITGDVDKPREFQIELDVSKKYSIGQILTWCAHEMTHLKQFVRGELIDYEDGSVKWKSRVFRSDKRHNDQPWEKEAYKMEDKLWYDFEEWYYGG